MISEFGLLGVHYYHLLEDHYHHFSLDCYHYLLGPVTTFIKRSTTTIVDRYNPSVNKLSTNVSNQGWSSPSVMVQFFDRNDSWPQMNSKAHKPKLELEITSPKPQKTGSSHKNLWHEESTYCIPNLKLDWLIVDCNHACPKFHANSQIMNRLKPLICKL